LVNFSSPPVNICCILIRKGEEEEGEWDLTSIERSEEQEDEETDDIWS